MSNYRNAGTLETFRDDLGIYLKILRSAMIELINEDYADFVNLSANLIDLDKSINTILNPLKDQREEIQTVRVTLTDCMNEINECISEKRQFRQMKKSLKTLDVVRNSLGKLRKLMDSIESQKPSDSDSSRSILLERAALELIQLQFNMRYCSHLLEPSENSYPQLEKQLLQMLNDFFLTTLNLNDHSERLEKCLRIYYTLDQCGLAENIFREKIVSHYMEPIINEKSLQNHPNGLSGIYNQILDFVSLKMKSLLMLTRGNNLKIKGYNFLFNSFWFAIEERLETNLSSIFAPGNPDNFYQKYKCSLEFLIRIEMIIDDDELVEQFHQTKQYKNFQKRWNLPVYFQIRFQEIATNFEKICEIDETSLFVTSNQDSKDSNQFQLKVFFEAISCIAKCWMDEVYVDQLFHKFFKLSFQLIARMIHWIEEIIKIKFSDPQINHQSFYTIIHRDIEIFLLKLPQIQQLILQKLFENAILKDQLKPDAIRKCFETPKTSLEKYLEIVESKIVNELLVNCTKTIKNVQDVPRLFRKTNRDVPTKHLPYIEQLVHPIDDFCQKHSKNFQVDTMRRLLKNLFNQLTKQ